MKNFWNSIKSYVYIIVIVVLFRTFIATPAVVNGDSMHDTLSDRDLVIVNKIILKFSELKRFDIVVLYNKSDGDKIIKRIIGLPNEKIEYKENKLYINGVEEKLLGHVFEDTDDFTAETKDGEYFVLGDNRDVSKDSRFLGNFKEKDILGHVNLRFYPFDKIEFVD